MKISVLTPSFNSELFLERAIKSVLIQDYKNWEHIIVDANSTDNTVSVLKAHKHLKWVSEPDQGQSDAMNKAFKMATGDIIVYLNADDAFEPNVFQEVANIFKENEKVDMVVGNLYKDYGKNSREERMPSISLYSILRYKSFNFPLNPVSYFYKREIQESIGNFPLKNHFTMDYWFLLRAYACAAIYKSELFFGTFYFDEYNKSSDAIRGRKWLKKVRNEFLITHPKPDYFKHLTKNYLIKFIHSNPLIKSMFSKFKVFLTK